MVSKNSFHMVFNGAEFVYNLYFEPRQPFHCVLVCLWPNHHTCRESQQSVPHTAVGLQYS